MNEFDFALKDYGAERVPVPALGRTEGVDLRTRYDQHIHHRVHPGSIQVIIATTS